MEPPKSKSPATQQPNQRNHPNDPTYAVSLINRRSFQK
jgi:hypothetical protein